MCKLARVSRSGYYRWIENEDKKPKDYDSYLLIKEIFDSGRSKYGWRTIQMKLLDKGIMMNHKKIERIKRKYDLITKTRRRNPYKMMMKKTEEHRSFGNILNREFKQNSPQKVFCTDITCIHTSALKRLNQKIKDFKYFYELLETKKSENDKITRSLFLYKI